LTFDVLDMALATSFKGIRTWLEHAGALSPHPKIPFPAALGPNSDVFVSREIEAGKNFYTKIGSAWNVAKDGISITLDATPVDGRMVLFPVKERDD
jgi:hypothetical protein